jgi:hypothetical protein
MSTVAERMRRMRRRRVYGRRCVPVEVDQHEIDALVKQGFLKPGKREDSAAIGTALSTKLRVQRQYGANIWAASGGEGAQ